MEIFFQFNERKGARNMRGLEILKDFSLIENLWGTLLMAIFVISLILSFTTYILQRLY
jgi:hypothetical protein